MDPSSSRQRLLCEHMEADRADRAVGRALAWNETQLTAWLTAGRRLHSASSFAVRSVQMSGSDSA